MFVCYRDFGQNDYSRRHGTFRVHMSETVLRYRIKFWAKFGRNSTKAALFYSPVDCTDASDMHHSNASLMHRWINRWIKQRSQTKELSRWCLYKRTSYLKSDNNDMFCFFYGIRVFVCFYCFCFTVLLSVFLLPRDAMHKRGLCVMRCLCVCLSVRLSVKPWSLNSTQLVELSWVRSGAVITTRDSTQLNWSSCHKFCDSEHLAVCPVELSPSNDHIAPSNSTQRNQVTFQSRPSFLFHRLGKVNNKNNFHLLKCDALLCNAAMY